MQQRTEAEIRAATVGEPEMPAASITLVEPDPSWPQVFESEAARLRALLGDRVLRVEHSGRPRYRVSSASRSSTWCSSSPTPPTSRRSWAERRATRPRRDRRIQPPGQEATVTGVGYQLAQVNISRLKAPLTDPLLADFMVALAPVNAVADAATGFVWRLQTEDGDATAIRAFEWDVRGSEGVIVNMSVWTGIPTLMDFVYGDAHRVVLRRRRRWFERVAEATTALWWVPEGHRPTTGEAELRVLHLRERGPTAHAFTVRELYPAPDGTGHVGADDDWQCPV